MSHIGIKHEIIKVGNGFRPVVIFSPTDGPEQRQEAPYVYESYEEADNAVTEYLSSMMASIVTGYSPKEEEAPLA